MHYTIERLLKGDRSVIGDFERAQTLFSDLLYEHADGDVAEWAAWLKNNQINFEEQCGGREHGRELMGWVGFAMLYETRDGFGDCFDGDSERFATARKLDQAFSMGFSADAQAAADSYQVCGEGYYHNIWQGRGGQPKPDWNQQRPA